MPYELRTPARRGYSRALSTETNQRQTKGEEGHHEPLIALLIVVLTVVVVASLEASSMGAGAAPASRPGSGTETWTGTGNGSSRSQGAVTQVVREPAWSMVFPTSVVMSQNDVPSIVSSNA